MGRRPVQYLCIGGGSSAAGGTARSMLSNHAAHCSWGGGDLGRRGSGARTWAGGSGALGEADAEAAADRQLASHLAGRAPLAPGAWVACKNRHQRSTRSTDVRPVETAGDRGLLSARCEESVRRWTIINSGPRPEQLVAPSNLLRAKVQCGGTSYPTVACPPPPARCTGGLLLSHVMVHMDMVVDRKFDTSKERRQGLLPGASPSYNHAVLHAPYGPPDRVRLDGMATAAGSSSAARENTAMSASRATCLRLSSKTHEPKSVVPATQSMTQILICENGRRLS